MGDSPPKYGFLPNFKGIQGIPQDYSGVALSYGLPFPQQQHSITPTPEPNPEPIPESNPEPIPESTPESNPEPAPESSQTTSYPELSGESQSKEDASNSIVLKFDSTGYAWQFIGPETPFPYNVAVRAGRDADGSPIFAGRAFHEGDMIPAKVHPERHVAYVCYNGEEIAKYEYEILRSGDFVWEFATNGEVPIGAVEFGRTADGEVLYSARCLYQGTQTPGKLHPSHGCLYIPFNGEEVQVSEYEVLVLK